MMFNLKRLVSAAAGTIIAFSAVCFPVYADTPQQADDELTDGIFTYEIVNGTYTIIKCDPTAIVTEIPEIRNGYAVTAIGDSALSGCSFISELKIPSTIKSIGDNAFSSCTSLKKVELPEKLTEIPMGAFMGCSMLEDIKIPESVSFIGNYAFYGCTALKSINLPDSLDNLGAMVFAECNSIESIDAEACEGYVWEDNILYDSKKKKIYRAGTQISGDVYIGDSVDSIEPGAFSTCGKIENLFIPMSVDYIGEDAFGYCTALKNISFSEGLITIAPIAFKYCLSLENADIPTTVQEIGDGAFYNCISLKRAIIPEGVTSIGMGAFLSCKELKQTSIPKSVSEVGDNAFGFYENSETGEYAPVEDFKLSVYSGTAGEEYAKKSKIIYSAADTNLRKAAFIIIGAGIVLAAAVCAFVLMSRGKKTAPAEVRKADRIAKKNAEDAEYKNILSDKEK